MPPASSSPWTVVYRLGWLSALGPRDNHHLPKPLAAKTVKPGCLVQAWLNPAIHCIRTLCHHAEFPLGQVLPLWW